MSRQMAQQRRRNIPAGVHRDRRHPSVRVPELLVRAALAHLDELQPLEPRDHFTRLQDRD